MIKISVIIPAYNKFTYLTKALISLSEQDFKNFEIIIVDDGSPGDIQEILTHLDPSLTSKIKYIHQSNSGCAAARNRGVIESTGDYVCFLDEDDTYLNGSLSKMINAFNYFESDFAIGGLRYIYGNKSRLRTKKNKNFIKNYSDCIKTKNNEYYLCDSKKLLSNSLKIGFPNHISSIIVRRAYFDKIGMFDSKLLLSEDVDLLFRLHLFSNNFIFIDTELSVYNYYLNSHSNDVLKLFKYERQRYLKHIKILNNIKFDKKFIKQMKKRICGRKYKVAGLLKYQAGKNIMCLSLFFKSWFLYRHDSEISLLIIKALIPNCIKNIFKFA